MVYVIIYLLKLIECTVQRVNPNASHGLCMTVVYQCWFIDCNKCTTVVQDVDGGGTACLGELYRNHPPCPLA